MNDPKPTYVVDADKILSSHPKELWAYRELYLLLVKRDFVAAYKQTVLGSAWAILHPLLLMAIFTIFFGLAALSSMGMPPLNGFIGEITILAGAYRMSFNWAFWAAVGIALGAAYLFLSPANLRIGTGEFGCELRNFEDG